METEFYSQLAPLALEAAVRLGGLDPQTAEGYLGLCEGCCQRLLAQLRRGVDPREHRQRLALAAAGLLLEQLEELDWGGTGQVRMGDLSWRREGSGRAGGLLRLAEDLMDSEGVALQWVR